MPSSFCCLQERCQSHFLEGLDGQFTVEVEIRGVVTTMPHKVVAQVERHLASIRKAQRSDAAKERAQALKEVGLTPFLKTAEGGWHE